MISRRALLAVTAGVLLCAGLAQATRIVSSTPTRYHRSEALSYLGFSQWSSAHEAAEYAAYLQDGRPASDYPYWGQVAQQWSGYGHVLEASLRKEAELTTHARILTDAGVDTLGRAIRSGYEVTVGRLAELTRGDSETSEERYAAKVAQDYADFVRQRPWYEFDFAARLAQLWREQDAGAFDAGTLRKWERRYAMTSEYASKAVLAWVSSKLASAAPQTSVPGTAVVVDRWVDRIAGNWPEMQRVRSFADGGELVLLPRHDAFRTVSVAIARSGANFAEIAGNGADTPILVSVIVPKGWRPDSEGSASLFEQPMLTLPEQKRVALTVPVRELAQTLRELDGMQITIERIYDY